MIPVDNGTSSGLLYATFYKSNSFNLGGIYVSADGGKTWSSLSQQLPSTAISDLLSTSSLLIAGSKDQGVFVSTDGGQNWSAANTGLNQSHYIYSLSTNSNVIVVSTMSGVYISPL